MRTEVFSEVLEYFFPICMPAIVVYAYQGLMRLWIRIPPTGYWHFFFLLSLSISVIH